MMREKAGRNRRSRLIFQRLKRAIYLNGERKHSLSGRSWETWMCREARAEVAAERANGVNPSVLLLVCRKGGCLGAGSLQFGMEAGTVLKRTRSGLQFFSGLCPGRRRLLGLLHPLLGCLTCPGSSEISSVLALSVPLPALCMPGQLAWLVTLCAAVCGIRSGEDTKFYQESRKTGHRFRES